MRDLKSDLGSASNKPRSSWKEFDWSGLVQNLNRHGEVQIRQREIIKQAIVRAER